jgi:hypothetical protein
MAQRLCALSVDLDEIGHYHAIHGMAAPAGDRAPIYDVAVPRLARLARALDLPLTFFAVGADLSRARSAAALHEAVAEGHAVGNHTQSHLYDFTRRGRDFAAREIDEGAASIERACGVRPKGFRAPGYTITDEVLALLRERGVAYDSSVFPCPAYKAAKDLAITLYSLLGKPSRSVVDTPAVLLAPTRPYRVGARFYRRGEGLLELPIQVTRRFRLPFIGTSLIMAGPDRARMLTAGVIGEPLVNLELHGIDLLDERDEGLEALRDRQRDVRIPIARKEETFGAVVETLRREGYAFVTLDEAAEAYA